tara:strand:- start:253 stop:483 length:231 start_codon:yes stop_codon:yes gene_type:complete
MLEQINMGMQLKTSMESHSKLCQASKDMVPNMRAKKDYAKSNSSKEEYVKPFSRKLAWSREQELKQWLKDSIGTEY